MCYNEGIPNGKLEKAFDYQQCFKLSERLFCNALSFICCMKIE